MTEFHPEVPNQKKAVTTTKKKKTPKKADHKHKYHKYFEVPAWGKDVDFDKRLEQGRSVFAMEIQECVGCGKRKERIKMVPAEKFKNNS